MAAMDLTCPLFSFLFDRLDYPLPGEDYLAIFAFPTESELEGMADPGVRV